MKKCSKLRKDDCKKELHCQWIVGKGCYAKEVNEPKQVAELALPRVVKPIKVDQEWYCNWIRSNNMNAPEIDISKLVSKKNLKKRDKNWFISYLPAGTKLYHGSQNKINEFGCPFLYFGINPNISFWILTESEADIGYLYEFEITKDIPVIFRDLPYDDIIDEQDHYCFNQIPCLKFVPILKFKDLNSDPEVTLGEELIVPCSYFSHIKYILIYTIDIKSLRDNYDKSNYDYFESIMGIIDTIHPTLNATHSVQSLMKFKSKEKKRFRYHVEQRKEGSDCDYDDQPLLPTSDGSDMGSSVDEDMPRVTALDSCKNSEKLRKKGLRADQVIQLSDGFCIKPNTLAGRIILLKNFVNPYTNKPLSYEDLQRLMEHGDLRDDFRIFISNLKTYLPIKGITKISGPSVFYFWKNIFNKQILLLGEDHYVRDICSEGDESALPTEEWIANLNPDQCIDVFLESGYFHVGDPGWFLGTLPDRKNISGPMNESTDKLFRIHARLKNIPNIRLHFSDLREMPQWGAQVANPMLDIYKAYISGKGKTGKINTRLLEFMNGSQIMKMTNYILGVDSDSSTFDQFLYEISIIIYGTSDELQSRSITDEYKKYRSVYLPKLRKAFDKMQKEVSVQTLIEVLPRCYQLDNPWFLFKMLWKIPMDAYNMARLFIQFDPRKIRGPEVCLDENTVRRAIIYSGHAHTETYKCFLEAISGEKPTLSINAIPSQCINLPEEFSFV